MMQTPDRDLPSPGRACDPLDAGARDLGAELVATVDLERVATQLAALPGAALLAELDGIVAAIDNLDPIRRRRRAGFWGRLLGRDLVAQAQPDPVQARLRVGQAAAQAHADDLRERTNALQQLAERIQRQLASLDAVVDRERATLAHAPAGAAADLAARYRRLDHLAAIAASWRASVAHIALVHAHAAELLARHAQVRDLLLSLWQAQASARAASTALDHDGIARLQASLRDLSAQYPAAKSPAVKQPASTTFRAPPGAAPDRPTQEPLP